MEDGRSSSSCRFARFPELASFVMHLTAREDVRDYNKKHGKTPRDANCELR
jgi:hypothetical protein